MLPKWNPKVPYPPRWIAYIGLTDAVLKETRAKLKLKELLSVEMHQPILSVSAPGSKYSALRKNKPISSPCN